MDKERRKEELKIIHGCYESIITTMNYLVKNCLDYYEKFENKEELNKLIEIQKDFYNSAITESNNIINKILEL